VPAFDSTTAQTKSTPRRAAASELSPCNNFGRRRRHT
jgi:hypothetical protein